MHSLEADGPELLPYATLTNARRHRCSILSVVGAVYEWQDAPLVFLVDADQIDGDTHIHKLRRLLAMRGDAPYLGISAPGRLDVYSIALDRKTPAQARITLDRSTQAIKDLFPHLANRRPKVARKKQGWISSVVLNLLTDAVDGLIGFELEHGDAISLVGRVLFARFLGDRDLLPADFAAPEISAALFDNAANARATCIWLDRTFNGDLLPLSNDIFDRLPADAYHVLGNIMRRAQGGQLFLGWAERWDQLDFAHIPVDDLRGRVLHRIGSDKNEPGAALGSLGPLIGEEHRGRYDVVVGNPPWSTGTKLPNWPLVLSTVARIASERAGAKIAPPLPNEVLDLPFVWRAMEWAKPDGQIAFALHARLLFQQGDGMIEARQMLFQALDVTSIINGVELRQTKVWPEISAPFCLLIATNRMPETGAGFRPPSQVILFRTVAPGVSRRPFSSPMGLDCGAAGFFLERRLRYSFASPVTIRSFPSDRSGRPVAIGLAPYQFGECSLPSSRAASFPLAPRHRFAQCDVAESLAVSRHRPSK